MSTARVRLEGEVAAEKETLLGTLYGRALDARSSRPILRDCMAAQVVERIDYTFRRLGITAAPAPSAALRPSRCVATVWIS